MTISKNSVVSIHYTLTDDEGKELDSSIGKTPLEYIHGNGYLISGLEKQLEGKSEGDKFTAVIEPKDAYGEYNEAFVQEVNRNQFPEGIKIEEGMQFQADTAAGSQIVTVTKVTDDKVTVDANHELAGKRLHFDVEVVSVREATEEEIDSISGGCGCGDGGCGGGCSCDGGCGGGCSCGE